MVVYLCACCCALLAVNLFVWCSWVFVGGVLVLSPRWLCNCLLVAAQLAENWFCMVVVSVMACCLSSGWLCACVFVDLCCCGGF